MSKRPMRRKATSEPVRGNNEVGYGRPPKEHQFKPGRSGNPQGRPKGTKNETTIFREIATMKVPMRVGGRMRKVPLLKAMWLRVADDALKGSPKAIALFVNRYRVLEGTAPETVGLEHDDQEILANYARGIAARLKKNGDDS